MKALQHCNKQTQASGPLCCCVSSRRLISCSLTTCGLEFWSKIWWTRETLQINSILLIVWSGHSAVVSNVVWFHILNCPLNVCVPNLPGWWNMLPVAVPFDSSSPCMICEIGELLLIKRYNQHTLPHHMAKSGENVTNGATHIGIRKKKQFWAHKMTWPIIDARIIVAILKSWITGQVAGPREGKVCRFFLPRCLDAIISSDQKRVHELPHLKMRGVTSCDMIFVPIPFCRKHDIFVAEVAASYRSFVQSLSFKLELGHALYWR